MKRIVNFSFSFVFSIIVTIVGISMLCINVTEQQSISNALDISDFYSTQIEKDGYLKGTVSDFLVYNGIVDGEVVSIGDQGGIEMPDGTFYPTYTIKSDDHKYFMVRLTDEANIAAFENTNNVFENGRYIELKVVDFDLFVNYEWYKTALGVASESEVDKALNTMFILEETDFSQNSVSIWQSLAITAIGIMLFYAFGGVKAFVIHANTNAPISERDQRIRVLTSGRMIDEDRHEAEYILRSLNVELNMLKKQHSKIVKKCVLGMFLIALGFVGIFISNQIDDIIPALLSIICFAYALKHIYNYFINTHYKIAISLTEFLKTETVREKIDKINYEKQKIVNHMMNKK